MAKNLVVDILLNNNNFSRNLQKCKTDLDRFKTVGNSVVSSLGKMAGAIGLAGSAMMTFDKFMHSTQITGDKLDNSIAAATSTVDFFFESLNRGSFSYFLDNLGEIIGKMKELAELEDSLGDAQLSQKYNKGVFNKKYKAQLEIMNDPDKTKEEKLDAADAAQKLLDNYKKKTNDTIKGVAATIKASYSKYGVDISEQDIRDYFSIYNNDFSMEDTAVKFREWKQLYQARINTNHADAAKRQADANPYFYKMYLLNTEGDKGRQKTLNLFDYQDNLSAELSDILKQLNRQKKRIENEGNKKTTSTTVTPKPKPEPDDETEEYKIDLTTIKGIHEEIKRLEEEKTHAEFSQIPALNEQISKLQTIKKLASEGKLTPDGKGVSVIDSGAPTLPNFTPVKEDNGLNKNLKGLSKNAKLMNNLARSIRGVGDAMAATGNQSKEMARSMAMVSAAASIAMMISIMVEKSKESLTIWDWIAGITAGTATVVAMAAQLRSINTSRFAEGGIVPGNNTIGDMNIVRVNSGEMILNTRQQRNLFNLLNGNGGSTGSSSSQVEFKIRGKELVGVLDNYNNKVNRVR